MIRQLDEPEPAEARRVALARVATLRISAAQHRLVELLLSYVLPEDEMAALADGVAARIANGSAVPARAAAHPASPSVV